MTKAVAGRTAEWKQIERSLKKEQRKLRTTKFLHNKSAVIGMTITVIMLLVAILASLLCPKGPYELDVINKLQGPSASHLLGTDNYGRDLLARILYGSRISMGVGLSVAIITTIIGLIVGLIASYYKHLDNLLMRICDGFKAVPSILLAIALMAFLGSSTRNVIFALSIVHMPDIARIVRSKALVVKEQTYIEAMKSLGAKDIRIILVHILPNVLSAVIVQASYIFATAIISEAALSFLGVGVPVPTPSWGNILNDAKNYIYNCWWLVTFPGLVMAATVLGLNLFGDGIRDVLDPMTNG